MSVNRLTQVRKHLGFTQADLAKKLNMEQSYLSRMERGDRPFSDETIKYLAEKHGISAEWLLFGTGDMLKVMNVDYNVLLFDAPALASYYTKSDISIDLDGKYSVPGLPKSGEPYVAVYVNGDSMYPTLNNADLIIAQKVPDGYIEHDRVHLIAVKEGALLIKRVRTVMNRSSSNYGLVELVSDNNIYTPMYIHPDDIQSVFKVVKRITSSNL